jgi:hypothetical protein
MDKINLAMLAYPRIVLHLCVSDEVFTVTNRKTRKNTRCSNNQNPPILLNFLSNPEQPNTRFSTYLSYPKLQFMKAISTLVTLFLIITTCATSAVLYLNENYNISAALCIVWILSLTIWIGKTMGLVDLVMNKAFAKNL